MLVILEPLLANQINTFLKMHKSTDLVELSTFMHFIKILSNRINNHLSNLTNTSETLPSIIWPSYRPLAPDPRGVT